MSADRKDYYDELEGQTVRLFQFGFGEGEPTRIGSNTPVSLNDPDTLWLVCSGKVDIFAISMQDGQISGVRRHLFRVEPGQALFGVDLGHFSSEISIVAVGIHNTYIAPLGRDRFEALLRDEQHAAAAMGLLDAWIAGMSVSIEGDVALRQYVPLEPGAEVTVGQGEMARPRRGILWVKSTDGVALFLGRAELPLITEDDYIPISNETWLQAARDCRLYALDTATFVHEAFSWTLVNNFQRMVLNCIVWDTHREQKFEADRLRMRADVDRQRVAGAFTRLASVLEPDYNRGFVGDFDEAEPLIVASKIVGDALGIRIQARHDPVDGSVEAQSLDNIIHSSGIRKRRVALREDWWRRDNGPLLGFVEEDGRPVALIPTSVHGYDMVDPVMKSRRPVTPEVAATLQQFAYSFYRTLPNGRITAGQLLKFGFYGTRGDLLRVALMGLAGGVLGMLVPLVIGRIFGTIIPTSDNSQLVQFALVLLVSAIVAALFHVVRTIAVLRLEIKLDLSVQAAVWDRLLNLPTPFFRDYTAGDLSSRAMGISHIRRALSGTVVLAVLTAVFSVFNFGLLFYFDVNLAIVAAILVTVAAVATLVSGYVQVRYRRRLADLQGYISGMVLQFITGISKLRVAGVENRAFVHWARSFAEQKELSFRAGTIENGLQVFNSVYPLVATLVIFALVASSKGLSTGEFLAFYAAFTQFLLAGLQLSNSLISIVDVVPVYERVRPILEVLPEVDETKSDPGDLSGEIEVSRVSFRYTDGGPLILRDVSFHVNPGDFVALVGPSGSGKSTLFRQLLGFETPESGGIFYDGQDLSGLDIRLVRQQLGVVLQNSQLMTGDIFTNIVGVAPLTVDDAWEAARMAGLDKDIEQMPMGIHTIISEGGSTLSGGQRQRLLIARAIAKKPRILFFDEATSALDNRTQAIVSSSLEKLDATRIVIAHRLSTIINADHILVLDSGHIVQSGTYEELVRQEGVFADLARRQLV